jgi:cell wall integrity and stress response component
VRFFIISSSSKTLVHEAMFPRAKRQTNIVSFNLIELDIQDTSIGGNVEQTVTQFVESVQNGTTDFKLQINNMNVTVNSLSTVPIVISTVTSSVVPTGSSTPPTAAPSGLSSGAIAGIILGCLFLLLLIVIVALSLGFFFFKKTKDSRSYSFIKHTGFRDQPDNEALEVV